MCIRNTKSSFPSHTVHSCPSLQSSASHILSFINLIRYRSVKMPPLSRFKLRGIPHHLASDKPAETHSHSSSHVSHDVSTKAAPLVAVIGVGFVGTGLVNSFSSQYNVLGFDLSEDRLKTLRNDFRSQPNVSFTSKEADLGKATHFLISVPTLLRSDKTIDLSYLQSALRMVEQWARRGSTVVIESSVAIGATRELLGPIAKARGLFAGMSPEVRTSTKSTSPR